MNKVALTVVRVHEAGWEIKINHLDRIDIPVLSRKPM